MRRLSGLWRRSLRRLGLVGKEHCKACKLQKKSLRLEPLEERQLLSVVTGTAWGDVLRIDLARGEYRLNHSAWMPLASGVSFDGQGGRDTVHVIGSSGDETVTLGPSGGEILSGGLQHSFSSVEQVFIRGNGGSDTAALHGSAQSDVAVSRPCSGSGLVMMADAGGSYLHRLVDFGDVALNGEGGGDSVAIYGDEESSNQFEFDAASLCAVMDSGMVATTADGFETVCARVRGRGGAGGEDTAVLTGSTADETYTGNFSYGELSGSGYIARVVGFDDVIVNGVGGDDRADLMGSRAGSTVIPAAGWAESVQVSDGRHCQCAVGFRLVKATEDNSPNAIEVDSIADRTVAEETETETIAITGQHLGDATLSLVNSNPGLVTASLDGTSIVLDYTPNQCGSARIGLRADRGDSSVFTDFYVTRGTDPVTVETVQNAAEGGQTGQFRFTRSDSNGYLTVYYTISGTATNGTDYSQIYTSYNYMLGMYVASVTFSWGQATATVNVSSVDDASAEGNETVIATLQAYSGCCCCCGGGGGYTVGSPGSATVTIIDNDSTNHAPVLDDSGSMSLTGIDEDPATNAGTLVADIIASAGGDRITDQDSSALEGIAVTGVDNSNGTWQYSTNSGTDWSDFGSPSGSSARLLAASATTRVRFAPNSNWNGTVSTGLSFRAWDQTTGSNGGTADTTTNGGSTAFSTATETASITVSAINDPPVNTVPGSQTTDEDTAKVFSTGQGSAISISDADAGANSVEVTLTGTHGAVTLSGTSGLTFSAGDGTADASMTFTGTISSINAALNGLSFTPAADYSGSASLQISTDDQGNSGGSAQSDSDTVTIAVTAVNDAPALDNTGSMSLSAITKNVATNPGTLVSLVIAHAGGDRITDPDTGAVEGIAVTAVDNTNGTWQYSTNGGTDWSDFAAPSGSSSRLLAASADTRVRFVPNTDWYGTVSSGLTFRAWDQTSGSNGGTADTTTNGGSTAFSTATETASIVVRELNHAPVLDAVGNKSGSEHQLLSFTLSATDPDDTPPDNVSFSATGLPTGATLNAVTGEFAWTPDWTQQGQHVVTFTVTDDCQPALGDSEQITIGIADVDSPPVVENDAANGFPDARESGNVLTNDFDPESESLTVTAVEGQSANLGEWVAGSIGGKFKMIADGSWVFDPDGDFDDLDPGASAATSITYTAGDGTLTTSGTLTVTVVRYPAVADNGAANYVETGTGWQTGSGEYGSSSRYHAAGSGGATAHWAYSNVPDGVYNVMVTWLMDSNCSTAATFTIRDGSTIVGTVSVDQTVAPLGFMASAGGGSDPWQSLGAFAITTGQLSVELAESEGGEVRADGVRFDLADPVQPITSLAWTGLYERDLMGSASLFVTNPTSSGTTVHPFTWSVERNPDPGHETEYRIQWATGDSISSSGTSEWLTTDGDFSAVFAQKTFPVEPGAVTIDGLSLDGQPFGDFGFVASGLTDGFVISGRFIVDWGAVTYTWYSGAVIFDVRSPVLEPCGGCSANDGDTQPGTGQIAGRDTNDLELAEGCTACGGSATGGGLTAELFNRRNGAQDPLIQPFGTGFGWQSPVGGRLVPTADGMAAVVDRCPVFFDQTGGGFSAAGGSSDALRYDPSAGTYDLISPDGTRRVFSDFFTSSANYPQGVLLKTISPSGHITEVTSFHEGMPETVTESFTEGATTTTLTWQYDYAAVTGWQDLAQSLVLSKSVDGGAATPLRRAVYSYYSSTDAYGSLGDLKTTTLQYPDGQGGWTGDEVTYYRYYETDSGIGFERGLQREVLPNAYEKLAAYMEQQYPNQGKTPLDASEAEVANYTCFYYEYDSAHRVTKETRFGNAEVFTYTYSSVETDQDYLPGYNTWEKRSTETRPDGTTYKVYTNFMGQTLLTDLASGSDHWYTYTIYDDAGRLLEQYSPAAVASYVDNGGTSGIDLVVTVNDNAGAVRSYTYYDDSLGVGAEGRLATESIRQGKLGTPVLLSEHEYSHHADSAGRTIHALAKTLVYETAEDSIETTYAYSYFTGTNAVQQAVTTLPVVSAGQNGSGVAATRTERYDTDGRVVWSKDERGAITHYEYDAPTGALTRTIEDVDTSGGRRTRRLDHGCRLRPQPGDRLRA